jgi:hypothetical protein
MSRNFSTPARGKARIIQNDAVALVFSWWSDSDLPVPLPPVLHPGAGQPAGPGDLEPHFPMALILQELSRCGRSRSQSPSAMSIACGGLRR